MEGRLLGWKQNALLPWEGLVGDLTALNVNRNISARLLVMYTLPLPRVGHGLTGALRTDCSKKKPYANMRMAVLRPASWACRQRSIDEGMPRLRGAMTLPLPAPALFFCRLRPLSFKHAIAATVVIVWMYWMRCMRCLLGYMAMSSAVLLGLMGGAVWASALDVFQLPCDAFTYYGALWNFAVVGVVAIFYQKVCVCVLLYPIHACMV